MFWICKPSDSISYCFPGNALEKSTTKATLSFKAVVAQITFLNGVTPRKGTAHHATKKKSTDGGGGGQKFHYDLGKNFDVVISLVTTLQ